ncbi:MAG: hypothetical protein VSS75_035075 [Candidatus Parabeggiatoa sp.]|nr:hypothetical protein [Candidatus Parabeggiatoa sp.]
MQVTVDEVKTIFKQLIEESISREEAAQWALIRMQANDNDQLDLSENEDMQIWDSILYFSCVDLKEKPDEYLHIKYDFIQEFFKIWGEQV